MTRVPFVRHLLSAAALAVFLVPTGARADRLDAANVMAPLDLRCDPSGRAAFRNRLAVAKSQIGIDAVSVDVWWGAVEGAREGVYDFSYYRSLFKDIVGAGLKVQAIMSFHQCGGNVGDSCKLSCDAPANDPKSYSIPIPDWIWNVAGDPKSMRYVSEFGNIAGEVVSLWRDDAVIPKQAAFITAFQKEFADLAPHFTEVTLSGGPAGELRYPSYNAHDGAAAGFPTRGAFQAHGDTAANAFRSWVLAKYGSVAAAGAAWGITLTDVAQIRVPSEGDPKSGLASNFIATKAYNSAYGRDFIDWYNGSLVDHGRELIQAADEALNGAGFSHLPLGLKLPGVHWQMMSTSPTPRAAEMAAGLIRTREDPNADATAHGYKALIDMLAGQRKALAGRRDVTLHFTCLEKDNMEWDGSYHAYSLAKDLVFWVARGAKSAGLPIKGENALSGGVRSDKGWDNIENAFRWASYSGLAVLRIDDVTDDQTGLRRAASFIKTFR